MPWPGSEGSGGELPLPGIQSTRAKGVCALLAFTIIMLRILTRFNKKSKKNMLTLVNDVYILCRHFGLADFS